MPLPLARRRFLQAMGAAVVLAACGDERDGTTTSGRSAPAAGTDGGGSVVVAMFSTNRVIAAGSPQRLPLAVFNADRTPRRDAELPRTTTVTIRRDGTEVANEEAELHGLELPFPYYPARTTLPEPGLYELALGLDDGPGLIVVQAFDPAEVAVPQVGDVLPKVPTPTPTDPQGVDPICTRFEPCPFHTPSLDQALGSAPVALLVGTPAYCQTGMCGPALEQLIAVADDHPGVTMIHAEVYANPREVDGNLADPGIRPAPVLAALHLEFEPVLFIVGPDGRVVDRLDNVFDSAEVHAALSRAV